MTHDLDCRQEITRMTARASEQQMEINFHLESQTLSTEKIKKILK